MDFVVQIQRLSFLFSVRFLAFETHFSAMISAKQFGDRILIEALPTHITNLTVESEDVQHIEKAFTGEITAQTLSIVIGEDDRRQLNNIAKFYEYLCTCFHFTESARIRGQVLLQQDQRIVVMKETSFEAGKGKKERITIRVILPQGEKIDPELKLQVKQQEGKEGRFQYVIRLKECFMNITTILLRCNSLVLGELEYFKMSEDRSKMELDKLYRSLADKMASQCAKMKADLDNFIKKAMDKFDLSGDESNARKSKKSKKKKHKSIKQVVKEEEENEKKSSDPSDVSPHFEIAEKADTVKQQGQQIEDAEDEVVIIDSGDDNARPAQKDVKEMQQLTHVKEQDGQVQRKDKSTAGKNLDQKIVKIPIEFDTTNPAYHFFSISSKTITKLGGFDYSMMLLTYVLPHEGSHSLTVKYALAKKEGRRACCIEVGIIDQKNKELLHSSKWQNLIKFKFNVPAVFTNVDGKETKKKYGKLRIMKQGELVEMTVNMKQRVVSWRFSFGEVVRADIPETFKLKTMVPFASIFTTGDMLQFMENAEQPQKKEHSSA